MKKLLLFLILGLGSFATFATHLMGGEITVQDLGNGQHQITLIVYRDTVGIPMDTTATFEFNNYGQNQSFSQVTPYDSVISGNLLPMYPYGVEIYLFMDTVSFPSTGMWEISWEDCCRNGAIQNLSNPLSEKMVLKTSLMVDSVAANSTPFFLVPAAIFLPLNTPWQYNPLPFDPDGDSLAWRIDTPLTEVNQYCANYTSPASNTTNPFRIDPVTGTISWTANTMGNFVASIMVDQYRNGQWIGHIRRDMQFIVVNAPGHPLWTNLGSLPVDSLGYYSYDINPGQSFKIEMIAGHTDSSRTAHLSMEAYSELLQNPQSGAQFSSAAGANNLKGEFSWSPGLADYRKKPYLVVFRVSDGFYTDDKAVQLNVLASAVDIPEHLNKDNWSIYPNPASNQVQIELMLANAQELKLEVYSLSGTKILERNKLEAVGGTNVFVLETSQWSTGSYLVRISDARGHSSGRTLMVR